MNCQSLLAMSKRENKAHGYRRNNQTLRKKCRRPGRRSYVPIAGHQAPAELARPAKSPYEAILRVNAQGMLFSFSERNYWEGLQVTSHGKSDTLIFTNVAVTAGIPDVMRRYVGSELPFGLQWEDDRVKAREKLAAAGWSNRLHAYKRDAWWLPDYHIRLTYQPGSIDQPEEPGIFDISLGIPMPASAEPFPPRYYPMPDQVYDLFGESPASPTFQSLFARLRSHQAHDRSRAGDRR